MLTALVDVSIAAAAAAASLFTFASPSSQTPAPRIGSGPRTHLRVSRTEIIQRLTGADSPSNAVFHTSSSLHAHVRYIPLTRRSAHA